MSSVKKGDRVRVNDPGEMGHGQSGEVRSTSPDGEFANVKLDSGRTIQFALELLEPEAKESRDGMAQEDAASAVLSMFDHRGMGADEIADKADEMLDAAGHDMPGVENWGGRLR